MTPLALALLLQSPVARPEAASAPFAYHERLAFVEARAGDAELLLLLDTGASASALDERAARELGLVPGPPVSVEGSAGVVEVASARLESLSISHLSARGLAVTVQDLSGTPRPPGARLDGILGSDFLAGFALELDFAAKRLTLRPGPLEPPPAGALALELDNRIPRLRARLDDLDVPLRIDTGASLFESADVYVNVTAGVWEELRRADPELAPTGSFSGTGTGGAVELPYARIHALALGERVLERPFVIVQPRAGYFARPDAVGFVGNNLLEKLGTVTIDYPGRRMWLGPSGSAKER